MKFGNLSAAPNLTFWDVSDTIPALPLALNDAIGGFRD